MVFSLEVKSFSEFKVLSKNVVGGSIAVDLVLVVKEHVVVGRDGGGQLEVLLKTRHTLLVVEVLELVVLALDDKVDSIFCVKFSEIVDDFAVLRLRDELFQEVLIISSPFTHRQLLDDQVSILVHVAVALDYVVLAAWHFLNGALEAFVPRVHGLVRVSSHQASQVVYDLARVVAGDGGAPASPNAISSIHKTHGNDRQVEVRLYALAFLF